MKSIDITIQDKEGLHARPAGILSKAAKGFESKVTMTKNGKVADMKKFLQSWGWLSSAAKLLRSPQMVRMRMPPSRN